MTDKTKAQLRAEAVERLKMIHAHIGMSYNELLDALIPGYPRNSQTIQQAIIDLLTDEPERTCKMDGYTDARFTVCQAPEVQDFEDYASVCECSNCGSSFIVPNWWDSVTPQGVEWEPWPKWEHCPVCHARIVTTDDEQQSDFINCGRPYRKGQAVLDAGVITPMANEQTSGTADGTNGTRADFTLGGKLPEGDAVAVMREYAERKLSISYFAAENLGGQGTQWEALLILADMVERDYVRRDEYDEMETALMKAGHNAVEIERDMRKQAEAERDNLRNDYEDAAELCAKYADRIAELEAERDEWHACSDEWEAEVARLRAERDELAEKAWRVDEADSRWEYMRKDLERMTAERDELQGRVDELTRQRDRAESYAKTQRNNFEQATQARLHWKKRVEEAEAERDEWKAIAKAHEMALDNLGQIADMSEKDAESVRDDDGMSDTREKLEADVLDWAYKSAAVFPESRANKIIGWLDRQAAITERDAFLRGRASLDDEFAELESELEGTRQARDELLAKWRELLAERGRIRRALETDDSEPICGAGTTDAHSGSGEGGKTAQAAREGARWAIVDEMGEVVS